VGVLLAVDITVSTEHQREHIVTDFSVRLFTIQYYSLHFSSVSD